MELNKIYCENCLDTMSRMPDDFIDLTVTSPPYDNLRDYMGYAWSLEVFKHVAKELYRVTKDGGVVVWVVGDQTKNFNESGSSFTQALYFKEIGFNLLDTMIWQKPNYAPMYPTVRRYDNNFEYMFIFSKGRPEVFNPIRDVIKKESSKQRSKYKTSYAKQDGGRSYKESVDSDSGFCKRTTVWLIPNGQLRGLRHPAPFPEQLANDHIISWSNEGDLIYDPFMGSGTTAKMAKLSDRNFIGSEISIEYCKIARQRIEVFNEKVVEET